MKRSKENGMIHFVICNTDLPDEHRPRFSIDIDDLGITLEQACEIITELSDKGCKTIAGWVTSGSVEKLGESE